VVCLLTVPVSLLVLFSIIPIFADSGSITIVSGKTYPIDYTSAGVKVLDAQADPSLNELVFTVQVLQNNGTLQITLPRQLIDSRSNNGTDSDFLVVVDGVLTKPQESRTSADRTIQFTHMTTDEKEIDVIGTSLASSTTSPPVSPAPPIQTIPLPPVQNQTSPPTVNVSKPVPTPLTVSSPPLANATPTKNFIQQNIGYLVAKIPYISSVLTRSSAIDYAVIGSIALVVVIVIASAARRKSNKLVHKRQQES
jgi:hypothetical protein